MVGSAFTLGEEISLRTIPFKLHHTLWLKYDLSAINLEFSNWTTLKYLNSDGTDFNIEVENLPNDKGGLYLFTINCPVIKGCTEFPAYIGRAQLTDGQNLRKRCKEYYAKYRREVERPKITTMFNYWSNDLYLSYLVLEENDHVIDYEKMLINSLLLPFNDQIPDLEIRPAVKAFQL
jgi:hypothetical protein